MSDKAIIEVHGPEYLSESDRATVTANGIVVDVIANEDGSVYVEVYAHEGRKYQAVVQTANVNRYEHRHPNFRVGLATPAQVRVLRDYDSYVGKS